MEAANLNISCTPVFHRAMVALNSNRFNVYVFEGGSRSSKTYSLIQFFIVYAISNWQRPNRIVIARKKSTWLSSTVWTDFKNILLEIGLYNVCRINNTLKTIQMYSTSFEFVGLDDVQRLHGLTTDIFWINEAMEASKDDFDQLEQRCARFSVLDYNPSAEEHWIYENVCPREDCFFDHSTMLDNNMSGWRVFRALLKNPKSDVTVLLITFFLTVIFDLTVAIEVGLVIACVLFMKRVMETTEISVITDEIDPNKESDITVHEENLMIPKGIEVYEINGPYFFGIATKFEETMTQLGDRPKVRIIRMRKVPFIDSTGIHNLTALCEMSQKEKTTIILSGVNENVHNVLEKAGFYELLGKENICPNINVALERAKSLVE